MAVLLLMMHQMPSSFVGVCPWMSMSHNTQVNIEKTARADEILKRKMYEKSRFLAIVSDTGYQSSGTIADGSTFGPVMMPKISRQGAPR